MQVSKDFLSSGIFLKQLSQSPRLFSSINRFFCLRSIVANGCAGEGVKALRRRRFQVGFRYQACNTDFLWCNLYVGNRLKTWEADCHHVTTKVSETFSFPVRLLNKTPVCCGFGTSNAETTDNRPDHPASFSGPLYKYLIIFVAKRFCIFFHTYFLKPTSFWRDLLFKTNPFLERQGIPVDSIVIKYHFEMA